MHPRHVQKPPITQSPTHTSEVSWSSLRLLAFFKKSIGLHGSEPSHSPAGLPLPGCHPSSSPTCLHAFSSLSPSDICILLPPQNDTFLPLYHMPFPPQFWPLWKPLPSPVTPLVSEDSYEQRVSFALHPSQTQHDPKPSFPWKTVEKLQARIL